VVTALARLPRPAVAGIRWTKPEQWHVTLRFLGQVGEGDVDALSAALAGVAARQPQVHALVGPHVDRFGRGILMVPVSGLDALAADTVGSTASFGEPPDPRPFRGHLTMARAARGRGDVRPLAGAPTSCSWPVDELTLVRSTTSPTGASYDVIGRWSLA
jgi:RNA 2',3'-cyclic 3'-phosphodiesterase